MSKFTFIKEEGTYCTNSKQTVEFSAVSMDEVLQQFETFLRGAGFIFDGNVNIVKDEESYTDSNYNFSNLPQNNWPFESITLPICPVCKIDNQTMSKHKCYDNNCPREATNAN
jgi:hypothetical protein